MHSLLFPDSLIAELGDKGNNEMNNKKGLRVFACLDIQNMWYGCRDMFGDFSRIDFIKLKNKILKGTDGGKMVAYTVDGGKDSTKFLKMLKANGFATKVMFMKFDKNKGRPYHTDWDVGITIDALNNVDDYDMFVLVSGDGDFSKLVEDLQRKGKKVRVMMFPNSLSGKLKGANEVLHLGKDDLYDEPDQEGAE